MLLLIRLYRKFSAPKSSKSYLSTIKTSKSAFYRQTSSGLAEFHKFNNNGLMTNSILNPHDLNSKDYSDFINHLYIAYSSNVIGEFFKYLYNDDPIIVQTMYFEANPTTWAHQDVYYLESSHRQGLIAIWIALEDIEPSAGRFYVCPGSHRLTIQKNSGKLNFAFNHSRYKLHVQNIIKDHNLKIVAPALKAGDVLFWSSRTIHGSLETTDPSKSRNSITAHLIPFTSDLIAFQSIKRRMNIQMHSGIRYHHS